MSDMPQFQVGETVIMHSPFTEEDVLVNYRGKTGDKAVVIPLGKNDPTLPKSLQTYGLQMSVPVEWLRKQEEKK